MASTRSRTTSAHLFPPAPHPAHRRMASAGNPLPSSTDDLPQHHNDRIKPDPRQSKERRRPRTTSSTTRPSFGTKNALSGPTSSLATTGKLESSSTTPHLPLDKRTSHELMAYSFPSIVRPSGSRQPWYLRAKYEDELRYDFHGDVCKASVPALVEKLIFEVADEPQPPFLPLYQNVFLSTFPSFMTADHLLDMLIDNYEMDCPQYISDAQFQEWKEKHFYPTQWRTIRVFSAWLEHGLLEEDSMLITRLTEFLALIIDPPSLADVARSLRHTIRHRRVWSSISLSSSPTHSRKSSNPTATDLLCLTPAHLAEHLALFKLGLFTKISSNEFLAFATLQGSTTIQNLCAAQHRLLAWVKLSILDNSLGRKRVQTIDFWISVAEYCQRLANHASVVPIVEALSSPEITRLELTWQSVSRHEQLRALQAAVAALTSPRSLPPRDVDNPGVPFVGPYLADLLLNQREFADDGRMVCFLQRQRWFGVISTMLRCQAKTYVFTSCEATALFVERCLVLASEREASWFVVRSSGLRRLELEGAEIRKPFKHAGF